MGSHSSSVLLVCRWDMAWWGAVGLDTEEPVTFVFALEAGPLWRGLLAPLWSCHWSQTAGQLPRLGVGVSSFSVNEIAWLIQLIFWVLQTLKAIFIRTWIGVLGHSSARLSFFLILGADCKMK